jgi:hypothetical protein
MKSLISSLKGYHQSYEMKLAFRPFYPFYPGENKDWLDDVM